MCFTRFILEMECLDELRSRLKIFFWNSFGNHVDILSNAHDLTLSGENLVDFVAVSLIHSNRTSFVLIIELRLLDECCDKVFDCTVLGNQNIEM